MYSHILTVTKFKDLADILYHRISTYDACMWHYVYILENPGGKQYVGFAVNLALRLQQHKNGQISHTSKNRPWSLAYAAGFPSDKRAKRFERFLKSKSGTIFRYRYLVPKPHTTKRKPRRAIPS